MDEENPLKTKLETCLEDNDKKLQLLFTNGTELITNIKVAHELRETERRFKEQNYCEGWHNKCLIFFFFLYRNWF